MSLEFKMWFTCSTNVIYDAKNSKLHLNTAQYFLHFLACGKHNSNNNK